MEFEAALLNPGSPKRRRCAPPPAALRASGPRTPSRRRRCFRRARPARQRAAPSNCGANLLCDDMGQGQQATCPEAFLHIWLIHFYENQNIGIKNTCGQMAMRFNVQENRKQKPSHEKDIIRTVNPEGLENKERMRNEELTLLRYRLFPVAKIYKPYEYAVNSTEQSKKCSVQVPSLSIDLMAFTFTEKKGAERSENQAAARPAEVAWEVSRGERRRPPESVLTVPRGQATVRRCSLAPPTARASASAGTWTHGRTGIDQGAGQADGGPSKPPCRLGPQAS
eukprot:bmy_03739T0